MGDFSSSLVTVPTAAQINTAALWTNVWGELNAIDGAWTAYTPTWTSGGSAPALGNGTIVGAYNRVNSWIQLHVLLTIGSTSTFGTGTYRFTLPGGWSLSNDRIFGVGFAFDSSVTTYFLGGTVFSTSSTATIRVHNTATSGGVPTSASPMTWATGDKFYLNLHGELA